MLNSAAQHADGERQAVAGVDERAAEDALETLLGGKNLDQTASAALFGALVAGALDEPSLAAIFVALRLKGETADELIGAATALRAADTDFPRPDYLFGDTCGTGGDGSGSINVSTSVAFVSAAAGLPIAKHGNRSFSSRCGSADVLEALGANLAVSPEQSRRMLDETGFCFLFAPQYHPGLRHAGPVRKRLKVRTVMNLLGPCLNPAEPPVQLLGVADPSQLRKIAQTLRALGVGKALVVHGSGLDEIAIHGATQAVRVTGAKLEGLTFTPGDAGVEEAPIEAARGGDAQENAHRLRTLLEGGGSKGERNLIAVNAGALLMVAGIARDLREGAAQASDTLASGDAARVLRRYVEASNG